MTRTTRLLCGILAGFCLLANLHASENDEPQQKVSDSENDKPQVEEQLVIYGSKSQQSQAAMGNRTIVITAAEIATYQWQSVAEVLTSLPGLSVVAQGGSGTLTRVFARGAASENTLVLLDGARLNDPSGVGRGFDFAHLNTAGIARIEVILGPQTTLYGTDASSGVINIVSNKQLQTQVATEVANEAIYRFSAETRIMLGQWQLGVMGARLDADDLSARSTTRFESLEADRYTNTTIRAQLSRDWEDLGRFSFSTTLVEGKGDIDSFDGDDPNHVSDYQQDAFSASYQRSFIDGRWLSGLHTSFQQIDRLIEDAVDPDTPQGAASYTDFNGEVLALEWRNNINLGHHLHLLAGAAYEQEKADGLFVSGPLDAPFFSDPFTKADAATASLFTQLELRDHKGFNASVGGRFDDHDQFGSETTYRGSLSYAIPKTSTRLRASVGTGFKAPSLYQLYSTYGNLDVLQETSEAFELGIEGDIKNGFISWGASYFDNTFENQIGFFFDPETFASFYDNLERVETEGWEIYASLNAKRWQLSLSYDQLDAEDRSTPGVAIPLNRRYEDKASVRLSGKPIAKLQIFSEAVYHGESLDSAFGLGTLTLDDYTLVDLGLSYAVAASWQLTLHGENIFNKDYVRVLDYQTTDARYYLGVRYKQSNP